jgi:NAD(P)H-flavin reductase
MLAKKYKSEIVSILNPFEGIYTLGFKSLGRSFRYHPGQFLHLAIDKFYDGIGQWPDSRCFSMQSNSNDEVLKITYAVKGSFTSQMEQSLKVGSKVWLKLPYGDLFSRAHNKENTVFIAGGTGITPFLSLFTHNSFSGYLNPKIYLGFRSELYNIYREELTKIKNKYFYYKPNDISIWYQDKDGIINLNNIFKDNGSISTYYLSGPPSMITIFKEKLNSWGVPSKNIISDDWV